MKKSKKLVRVICMVLCLVILCMLFQNYFMTKGGIDEKKQSIVDKADEAVNEEEILKKEYEQLEKQKQKVERIISNDIEIVLLTISDEIKIAHGRYENASDFTKWLVGSNVLIGVRYTAIIVIPTSSIQVQLDNNKKIVIYYNMNNCYLKAVNIEGITTESQKGLFGKEYTPSEISALTLIATDKVKEEIVCDKMLNFMSEQNLINHLSILALKLGIYDAKVIPKS